MTSPDVNDLDYYDKLLSILENDYHYEVDSEIDAIQMQCAVIKSGVRMRMIADRDGMMEEQHFCKVKCCRVLLRSLELWKAIKEQPITNYGERVLKNAVVMILTATLEELYFFYNDLSKMQTGDI